MDVGTAYQRPCGKTFNCEKCSKEFHLKWQLKKHEEGHNNMNVKFCYYVNYMTNIFERIISKIPPKNCHFWAKFSPKFRPIQNLMPTISKKLHQWSNNYVTIQSLALWLQNGPQRNFNKCQNCQFHNIWKNIEKSHEKTANS